jgi:hypothetical protein
MNIFLSINHILSLYYFKKKWRRLNLHNQTFSGNIFPLEIVKVGK